MKKSERVSVIVPVYNVEKYLDRCIDSIISQSYKNLEIILVDDGSTDASGKICDNYVKKDKRIVVIHKRNGGLSDARNTGIKRATGAYLSFIDSDDSFEINSIEYLLDFLKRTNADVAIGKINVIKGNKYKKHIVRARETILNSRQAIKLYLIDTISTSSCAKLYKRKIFEKIRFPVGKIYEDNGIIYKTIDSSNIIALSNKNVYNYYINSNTLTTGASSISTDLLDITDKMCEELKGKYPELSQYMVGRKILARFKIINKYLEQGIYRDEMIDKCVSFIKNNKNFIKYMDPKKQMAVRILLAHKGTYAKIFSVIKAKKPAQ